MKRSYILMIMLILALTLITVGQFKDYALYQTAVYASSTETTAVIEKLIIENCPWNHVGVLLQDTAGAPADSVNCVFKWAVYSKPDTALIGYYELDSLVVADSGTWTERKNLTPPTLGHWADLMCIPRTGFKVGNPIKITPRIGCYYPKVDVRQ